MRLQKIDGDNYPEVCNPMMLVSLVYINHGMAYYFSESV